MRRTLKQSDVLAMPWSVRPDRQTPGSERLLPGLLTLKPQPTSIALGMLHSSGDMRAARDAQTMKRLALASVRLGR